MVVNGYSSRWLEQGFDWVYPKELVAKPPKVRSGDMVRIRSEKGAEHGTGIWDEGWIAVRRFRGDHGPIDAALLGERLDRAFSLRRRLIGADTSAFRWVNAENDSLPGIRVDAYGHFLVVSLDLPTPAPIVPSPPSHSASTSNCPVTSLPAAHAP